MSRLVICVEQLVRGTGDIDVYFRVDEPNDVVDWDKSRPLLCSPADAPFVKLAHIAAHDRNPIANELVKTVGEGVFAGLAKHLGVQEAFNRAVYSHQVSDASPWPLYINIRAPAAEALPWEILYHPKGEFLSLDARWPMARMVGSGLGHIERVLELPIRLAIVLGATQLDATPEWEAIYEAISQSGLDYKILVLVAQPALEQHILNQADGKVTVEYVPPTEQVLVDRLIVFCPHFLHFFCHGSVNFDGFMEIATRNHLTFGDDPVYLSTRELLRMRDLVWLITLDACEGATPTRELSSFSYSLVKDGVPAVIGMREPIEAFDASVFCGAFYSAALSSLAVQIGTGNAYVKLSWEFALRSARAELCGMFRGPVAITAAQHKVWTLPVLYRKPGDFNLLVKTAGTDPAETLGEVNAYRQLRDGLAPSTPQEVRDHLDEFIRQAELSLYGSPEGASDD
jgi:hypothetical protein